MEENIQAPNMTFGNTRAETLRLGGAGVQHSACCRVWIFCPSTEPLQVRLRFLELDEFTLMRGLRSVTCPTPGLLHAVAGISSGSSQDQERTRRFHGLEKMIELQPKTPRRRHRSVEGQQSWLRHLTVTKMMAWDLQQTEGEKAHRRQSQVERATQTKKDPTRKGEADGHVWGVFLGLRKS